MRRGINVGSFLWSRLTNSFSETSESFDSFESSTNHSTRYENDLHCQNKNQNIQKSKSIYKERMIDAHAFPNDSFIFATSPSILTNVDRSAFHDDRSSFQSRISKSTKKSKSASKMNTISKESCCDDEKQDMKQQKNERHFASMKKTNKKKRTRKTEKKNIQKQKNDLNIANKIMVAGELGQTSTEVNSMIGLTNYRNEYENIIELPFSPAMVGTYTCHGLESSENLHRFIPLSMAGSDMTKSIDFDRNSKNEKRRNNIDKVDVDRITGLSFVAQKINQDRGSVVFPYGNHPKTALFAVYDGHGDGGEKVSQFVMNEVMKQLQDHPDFQNNTNIPKALKDVFLNIDESLQNRSSINPTFCGTTACVVVIRKNNIYIANVGDSRAILSRRIPIVSTQSNISSSSSSSSSSFICNKTLDDGLDSTTDMQETQKQSEYEPIQLLSYDKEQTKSHFKRKTVVLTEDQNPDLPSEKNRIEQSGGYVSQSPEPGVSARVWINSTHTYLGLAMSRSIGDFFLKRSGVIAEPVVSSMILNSQGEKENTTNKINNNRMPYEDEFMVIASDGVWEYMDSEEVVKIVGKALDDGLGASEACKKLIVAAAMRWRDMDYYYRDDITAIVIRLNDGLLFHENGDETKQDESEEKGSQSIL